MSTHIFATEMLRAIPVRRKVLSKRRTKSLSDMSKSVIFVGVILFCREIMEIRKICKNEGYSKNRTTRPNTLSFGYLRTGSVRVGLAQLIRFLVVELIYSCLNPKFDMSVAFITNYFFSVRGRPNQQ
jgi:hypothetical protein